MLYTQIHKDERILIEFLFNVQNKSISEIAKLTNRNKSTISREIKRNSNESYEALSAQLKRNNRQWHKHSMYLLKYQEFTNIFVKKYDKRYFGIENTYMFIKNNYKEKIKIPSLRQVFNWVKSNRWKIRRSDRLRRYYKRGGKRTNGIFSKFNNKLVLPIWVRPKDIDLRQEKGHWEADLIVGKKANGFDNLLTFTERKTRYGFIARVKTKNPMKINSIIYKIIKQNKLDVKSITIDNGIEFQKIGILATWVKCKVYFCEPYASYQRGSNENFNGMVRRMWKKQTDFSQITDQEIQFIQDKINTMPRKLLNWNSSYQAFQY